MSFGVWSGMLITPSQADESKALFALTPSDMKWAKYPKDRPDWMQFVMLYGDVEKPGMDIFLSKHPPNVRVSPHRHPNPYYFTVLSGTIYVGLGETFDESKLKALPAGSFFIIPANVAFYDMTKGGGAILEIVSMGEHPFTWQPSSHN